MSTDVEGQYQDPLLNPGQLRQFVKNLPSKIKHVHDDYVHCDSDTLEREIDEFFSYTEVADLYRDAQSGLQAELSKEWLELSDTDKRSRVAQHLDQLESTTDEVRMDAAIKLVYISLGIYKQADQSPEESVGGIQRTNKLLRECGALSSVYRGLRHVCNKNDVVNQHNPTTDQLNTLNCEIDLYVTLLYLLLETYRQRPKDDSEELEILEPSLTEFLFLVVAQLREKYMKSFPVKKLIILLWKSLLNTFGGLEELSKAKEACTIQMNSVHRGKKGIVAKCSPQDLYDFRKEVTEKYPTYSPPNFPFHVSSLFSVKADAALARAMGISSATERADLPYQTLFPPKSSGLLNGKKQQMPLQPYTLPPNHSLVLPLSHSGPSVPHSIVEAGEIYKSNMHLSMADYQIIQEREKAIQRWQNKEKSESEAREEDGPKDSPIEKLLLDIEQFYATIVPELQNIVIVLLKLLLSTVTSNMTSKEERSDSENCQEGAPDLSTSQLEDIDANRNREILSKAIAHILFLMLKWLKISHVLKFEYLSKLLVDSGCLLLILKILGLQEITTLVASHIDIDQYSLFARKTNDDDQAIVLADDGASSPYTSRRNMSWTINFLRILQMLTKRKTHRIMLLVQYKSSAILKRILKVSHPLMETYTLKVLKSQVPYLGRKWRSGNMKIISSIYLRCHTVLKDDWISKNDPDDDLEDGMTQELNLRMLVGLYNGQRYLPHLLPERDDFNEAPNIGSEIKVDKYATEDIVLDEGFMTNYEEWLQNEVYDIDDRSSASYTDDTFSDSAEDRKEAINWDLGTPIPSPTTQAPPICPRRLAQEINKLYQEELEREFKANTPALSVDDGWESPTPMISTYLDEGGDYDTESPSNGDPLKDINWETLTEEELADRLNKVEERTVQRWLSVDINDPQYQKVLNAVEGLCIDTDYGDEGIAPIPGTEYDQ